VPVTQALIDEALAAFGATELRDLKTGGQKTVRLVERSGERFVMKVIAIESGAPDVLRRAQREVELLEQIDHDHVVKVASDLIELGVPIHGVTWLEEFLEGEDLIDRLGAQWGWNDAKQMATHVADGLGAIHAVKVVHRDLSANNVRWTQGRGWVVMDPGYARHRLRSTLTVAGQPGTLGYMSPEHLGAYSGVPTASSDIFCVGILTFEALAAELPIPFTGDVSDYFRRLARVEVADLTAFRNDLTPDQLALVKRMLHPQPARRPRNGAQLKEALEALT
jgi:eukaryotic-like serine/threonine-protein kinase